MTNFEGRKKRPDNGRDVADKRLNGPSRKLIHQLTHGSGNDERQALRRAVEVLDQPDKFFWKAGLEPDQNISFG